VVVGSDIGSLAAGAGSIWTTSNEDGTLTRIDPATNQAVATIPIRAQRPASAYDPFMVASDGDSVWVLDGVGPSDGDTQAVSQIDPATNQVTRTLPLPVVDHFAIDGRALAVGAGGLWIGDWNNHRVVRLDPQTGAVVASLPVGTPIRIALTPDAVWVGNRDLGTLVRIDPSTNQIVATIAAGREILDVAVSADAVWLTSHQDRTVQRVDPATNQIVSTTALPLVDGGDSAEAALVLVSDDAVWVGAIGQPALYRLDPRTNQFNGVLRGLGNDPNVISAAGSLWISNRAGHTVVRVNPTP
jgi:streptogramin lyase